MVCTFEQETRIFRRELEFTCSTDWADTTCRWAETRKRKMMSKKERPLKASQPGKASKQRNQEHSKPRKLPFYLKAIESRSAGPSGRFIKKQMVNALDSNREPVKCKVVSFNGFGTDYLRVQSVPNVNDQWSMGDSILTDRSNHSLASTINLDSGHKQNKFHKEQLILQLHERSSSLMKYLFGTGDSTRTSELHADNISLPIRQPCSSPRSQPEMPKQKHIILEPKDPARFGDDYVGSLIPDSCRPLGYGLFGTPSKSIKVSHKTLEFPDLGCPSKFLLPPVNSSHPIRSSIDIVKAEEGSSYINSVSQLVGMLCIEPNKSSLPRHSIQKWLDT